MVQNHAIWFTGLYFLCAGIYLALQGVMVLTGAFLLLVLATWLLALSNYTGKHAFGMVAAIISALDGMIFFAMAFANATGRPLP